MWFKILLWSILIGSILMGYLGIQTGSVGNAIAGICVILFSAFLIYFLAKFFFNSGIIAVKVILILVLIIAVVFLCIMGYQYALKKFYPEKIEEQEIQENMISNHEMESISSSDSIWHNLSSFFSFSNQNKDDKKIVRGKTDNTMLRKKSSVPNIPTILNGRVTEVRSGYFIRVDSHLVKLYGIDAPDLTQTCLDKYGTRYECGRKSKLMLERLVLGKEVTCQPSGGDDKGNYVAVCAIRDVDVGVALVSVGWAVADRKVTNVYIPYEEEAHRKKLGLWEGKFTAPWMMRTPNHQKKQTSKGILGKIF